MDVYFCKVEGLAIYRGLMLNRDRTGRAMPTPAGGKWKESLDDMSLLGLRDLRKIYIL